MSSNDDINSYIHSLNFARLIEYFVEAKTGKDLKDIFSEEECAQIKKIEELIAQQQANPNLK